MRSHGILLAAYYSALVLPLGHLLGTGAMPMLDPRGGRTITTVTSAGSDSLVPSPPPAAEVGIRWTNPVETGMVRGESRPARHRHDTRGGPQQRESAHEPWLAAEWAQRVPNTSLPPPAVARASPPIDLGSDPEGNTVDGLGDRHLEAWPREPFLGAEEGLAQYPGQGEEVPKALDRASLHGSPVHLGAALGEGHGTKAGEASWGASATDLEALLGEHHASFPLLHESQEHLDDFVRSLLIDPVSHSPPTRSSVTLAPPATGADGAQGVALLPPRTSRDPHSHSPLLFSPRRSEGLEQGLHLMGAGHPWLVTEPGALVPLSSISGSLETPTHHDWPSGAGDAPSSLSSHATAADSQPSTLHPPALSDSDVLLLRLAVTRVPADSGGPMVPLPWDTIALALPPVLQQDGNLIGHTEKTAYLRYVELYHAGIISPAQLRVPFAWDGADDTLLCYLLATTIPMDPRDFWSDPTPFPLHGSLAEQHAWTTLQHQWHSLQHITGRGRFELQVRQAMLRGTPDHCWVLL